MSDVRGILRKVKVVLEHLVSKGVITGFKTNFDDRSGDSNVPRVTVIVSDEWSLEAARTIIMDAITEVAVGVDVAFECA